MIFIDPFSNKIKTVVKKPIIQQKSNIFADKNKTKPKLKFFPNKVISPPLEKTKLIEYKAVETSQDETESKKSGLFSEKVIEIETEFEKLQAELDEQRKKQSHSVTHTKFYETIHHLTYGDFKKHSSPTSRLVEQKSEQLIHKKIIKAKNGIHKDIFYNCGVNSYVVKPKANINYKMAQT